MKVRIHATTGSPLIVRRGRWLPIDRRWPRRTVGATITGRGIPADTRIVAVSGPTASLSAAFTMLDDSFLTAIAGLAASAGMSEADATATVMHTAAAYPTTTDAELHRA